MSRFSQRSSETELMDDLELANDALRKNLDELETINTYLGGNAVTLMGLNQLLLPNYPNSDRTIRIADLGCGGGDGLRAMARWGRKKGVKLELIGIDANPFMLEYANEKARNYPEIQFEQHNIFDQDFQRQPYDIITCSLFCHHFSDEELVRFFQQWYQQTSMGVVINDIHRHYLAYHSIYWLTRIFRGSYLVKNDAPLSVLRAFSDRELKELMAQAEINPFKMSWKWAFRWLLLFGKAVKS
ncbi:MAG: methyltransferase domain-containing protein [Salibacteraceae bacterium]